MPLGIERLTLIVRDVWDFVKLKLKRCFISWRYFFYSLSSRNLKGYKGVIYIAFGQKYVDEAAFSAQSVKQFTPSLSTTLFTNEFAKVPESCFDSLHYIDAHHIRCKVDYLKWTPYRYTLYLDSDTKLNHDISELFEILDKFDIALVHDFARRREKWCQLLPEYKSIPYSFSEFGGGVILYRRTRKVWQFLDLWAKYFYQYKKQTSGWDQAALRIALWFSDLRIHTLPIEYNVRSVANREKANKQINSGEEPYLLKPRIFHWHGLDNSDYSIESYKY